ncbi:MAG: ATP-binding protein [Ilumatobacter sp.]|uniref:HAMP domain-containing sensor histidine kinase n=1 Tax=Ilumatobacter sp. TaxID=1967498 RepID=UPI00391C7857
MKLTTRIVVRSLLVMAVALGSVSVLTYEFVRVSGREDVDRFLRRESDQLIAGFATAAPDAAGADGALTGTETIAAARTALTIHPSGPQHVATITVDGIRIQATGGPPAVSALARGSDAPAQEPGRLRTIDTAVGPLRVLDVAIVDAKAEPLAVATLLAPLDPSRYAASNALQRTAIAGVIALILGGALLAAIVGRSLRPLRDLSTAAAGVTPETLNERIPVPDSHDEVEQLARELNEMLERIDDDDRTRRRYLAAISHEVRTPLTVAEGHLELLEHGQIEPAQAAATVRHELDRLGRVLDDLLSVARGVDDVDIRPGPIFLPDLFAAILGRVDALGLRHRVQIEPAPPTAFTGDQARIEQCVTNLVNNAIDHNPVATKVIIDATSDDATVTIRVVDDGNGIDPAIFPHVREPFVTTRSSGHRRSSGLGLAVVDSLTLAQQGSLHLDTGPHGTTATLTYPIEPPMEFEPV